MLGNKGAVRKSAANLKLLLSAQQVMPGSSIASVLGPVGVNIPNFCRECNTLTAHITKGEQVTVFVRVAPDKSYKVNVKSDSPVSYLIKKAANLTKGAATPGKDSVASIKMSSIIEIAKRKMKDMKVILPEAAAKMVAGTARSMGIKVIENE